MTKNYKQLVNKLRKYIKKYYFYRLIWGISLFIILIILYIASLVLIESFSYLNSQFKTFLIALSLISIITISIYFIIIPFLKLFGLGKTISYKHAAKLISQYFPEIEDKLLNILELASNPDNKYSTSLIFASIDQKIDNIKFLSFNKSIDFRRLKPYLLVDGLLISIVIVVLIFNPINISDSYHRLIDYKSNYEKPAPFIFNLLNDSLIVRKGSSLDLKVECSGNDLPELLYINIGNQDFLMAKENELFTYTIENINNSFSIYFTGNQYKSKNYNISVLPVPGITNLSLEVIPPLYTGLDNEYYKNTGDVKIVAASKLKWTINTYDTEMLSFVFNDSLHFTSYRNGNVFYYDSIFMNDAKYSIITENEFIKEENEIEFHIQIIPDLYPQIEVVQLRDSFDYQRFYFKGNIIDDYGFHELTFNLNTGEIDSSINLPVERSLTDQNFYYSFEFNSLRSLGDVINYYFTISDNDVVNHYKKTTSQSFVFKFPDFKEIVDNENSNIDDVEDLLKKSNDLVSEIRKSMEDFKIKQIDSKVTDWDKFQMINEIDSKRDQLESILEQISEKNEEMNNYLNSFSEEKKEVLEKQKQLEELLNEVMDEELKKLFDEFNKLAEEFNSRKFEQLSKEMDLSLEDLSKQLDRNMEMLKRMKLEQKMERIADELEKLSEKEKNNLNSFEEQKDFQSASSKEKENKETIEELQKESKNAFEMNNQLEKPMNLDDFEDEFNEIMEQFDENISQMEKGNKRKSSSGMQQNIQNLNNLSFSMRQMLAMNRQKQNYLNLENLKQIIENLIYVSFRQEGILSDFKSININDPRIVNLKIDQKELINQSDLVKDSLYALAKRTPEISGAINKELIDLEKNVKGSLESMEEGEFSRAQLLQQYGITSANNLALYLIEALEKIEKQLGEGMPGDQQCEEPGGNKPGFGSLKQGQQSLKDQLEKMIQQMNSGDQGLINSDIGKSLAQHEMMQQLLREMINGSSVGSDAKSQLQAIDQLLEQNRKDLIGRNIGQQLINRQNMILNRLLEAEKSEFERGYEEERKSKTAEQKKYSNPELYFEYNKDEQKQKENLKSNNYKLRLFYDQKYKDYINSLNK